MIKIVVAHVVISLLLLAIGGFYTAIYAKKVNLSEELGNQIVNRTNEKVLAIMEEKAFSRINSKALSLALYIASAPLLTIAITVMYLQEIDSAKSEEG